MTDSATHPSMLLAGFVLDTRDPKALAGFYEQLLGWTRVYEDDTWVQLRAPGGGRPSLSFQLEPLQERPSWPSSADHPQMQAHLDIGVAELDPAVARATALGATPAEWQPQEDVRVMLDPHGHPFCLFLTAEV